MLIILNWQFIVPKLIEDAQERNLFPLLEISATAQTNTAFHHIINLNQ